VAELLVPVSTLVLMQVLSRAATPSLDITALRAPPTVYSDRRKLDNVLSYILLQLAAMVWR
jgi:hypothetical protein